MCKKIHHYYFTELLSFYSFIFCIVLTIRQMHFGINGINCSSKLKIWRRSSLPGTFLDKNMLETPDLQPPSSVSTSCQILLLACHPLVLEQLPCHWSSRQATRAVHIWMSPMSLYLHTLVWTVSTWTVLS